MAANNDVKENEITQASAQATLANLKEIRVVTTDGSSKAYGKADFMAVIAAGIKSYFSSIAAGNIAGILTADSGKAGISALADVAQVLGVGFVVSGAVTPGNSYSFTVKSAYVLLWITERSGRGYAILTQGNQATPIYSTPGTVANLTGISYTRSGDIHTITLTNNDAVNLNWRVKIIDDIV